jgi:hypothetical protein
MNPCENTLQNKFMAAYCCVPNHIGTQQCMYIHSFSEAIRTILSGTPQNGQFKYWTEIVTDAVGSL